MGYLKNAYHTSTKYLQDSSIAGLSHAAKSNSGLQCCYWLTIFVLGMSITIPSLVNIVNDFNAYPVITKSLLEDRTVAEFPAVTFCGLNRIHCWRLYKVKSNTDGALDQSTVDILEDLYFQTNCGLQLCSSLLTSDTLPTLRTSALFDSAIFLAYKLDCWRYHPIPVEKAMIKYRLCYNLDHIINRDSSSNATTKATFGAIWVNIGCTAEDVCAHFKALAKLQVDIPESAPGAEVLEVCSEAEEATTTATTGATTTVAAGVNTTAILLLEFIQKTTVRGHGRQVFAISPEVGAELTANITRLFMTLPRGVRKEIGHQLEESEGLVKAAPRRGMLKTCRFLGEDCKNESFWLPTNDPMYGNCFTFNAMTAQKVQQDKAASNASQVTMTGSAAGLDIELYMDQMFYMPEILSQGAGMRLALHDPRDVPQVDEYGLYLAPSTFTDIGIQKHAITRLPSPYVSNCTANWTQARLDTTHMTENKPKYSLGTCKRHCIQTDIIATCSCFHIKMDLALLDVETYPLATRPKPCSMSSAKNNTDRECYRKIQDAYNFGKKNCTACQLACQETEYVTSYTVSTWPSDSYWKTLAIDVGIPADWLNDAGKAAKIKSDLQRDFLKALVYFKSLNVKSIEEEEKYTLDTIMSSLGGALSLYLGVAIILLFELIELGVQITLNIWRVGGEDEETIKARRKKGVY